MNPQSQCCGCRLWLGREGEGVRRGDLAVRGRAGVLLLVLRLDIRFFVRK